MEEADNGWLMIRIGVSGWIFLLVPTHMGSPRQRAMKWLLLFCYSFHSGGFRPYMQQIS